MKIFILSGMLMPGRFTSDTNSRCLLVSRSTWTTTMVDTCYPVAVLTGTASVLGVASFSSSGGTFAAAAPRATDGIILNQTVASGIDNVLTFDVVDLQDADEEGVLVTVLETIDNVPYVIGGGRLRQGKDQRIDFRATGNNIQVVLNGPYTNLLLAQVCTRYARSTAQTYLVEVCDESKDRYRFGFNGQEKVNEIAGVGNHNTTEFWEYDIRLGRRWNLDPVDQVSISNYAVNGLNPIMNIDPDGDDWMKNKESGEYKWDKNVTKAKNTPDGFKYVGLDDYSIVDDMFPKRNYSDNAKELALVSAEDYDNPYSSKGYSMVHTNIFSRMEVNIAPMVEAKYSDNGELLSKQFTGLKISTSVSSFISPGFAGVEAKFGDKSLYHFNI